MKISVDDLKAKQACADHVELFERTFGPGPVNVTKANCLKAAEVGLNLKWAAGRFLSSVAMVDFNKTYDAALADYKKAIAPAQADYDKAVAPAWADYRKALALAFWRAY